MVISCVVQIALMTERLKTTIKDENLMTKRNLKDIFHHLTVEQQNGILRILDDVSDHHLNAGVEAQFESVDPDEYDEKYDHSVIYNKVNEVIENLKNR